MTRQYNELVALFDNWDSYLSSKDVSANAAGTLSSTVDIYLESTGAKLQQLKDAWEDVFDSMMDNQSMNVLIEVLTKLTNAVADMVDGMGGGLQTLGMFGGMLMQIFNKDIGREIGGLWDNLSGKDRKIQSTAIAQLRAELLATGEANNKVGQEIVEMTDKYREYEKYLSNTDVSVIEQQIQQYAKVRTEIQALTEAEARLREIESNNGISFGNKALTKENVENYRDAFMDKAYKDYANSDFYKRLNSGNGVIRKDLFNVQSFDQVDRALERIKIDFNNVEEGAEGTANAIGKLTEQAEILKMRMKDPDEFIDKYKEITNEVTNLEGVLQRAKEAEAFDEADALKYSRIVDRIKSKILELNEIMRNGFVPDEVVQQELVELTQVANSLNNVYNSLPNNQKQAGALSNNIDNIYNGVRTKQLVADITNISGQIMSVTMGIQSLISGFKSLTDESLSFGEKMVQSLSGISFGLMSIAPVLPDIIEKFKLLMVTEEAVTTAGGGLLGFVKAFGAAFMGFQAAIGPVGWAIEAVVAALLAFQVIIPAIANAMPSLEKELVATKKAYDDLRESAGKAQQSISDTKSAFDDYKNIKNTLNDLVEGTDEWNEALLKNNSTVLELMNTYPELLSKEGAITKNANGALEISTKGIEAVIDSSIEAAERLNEATNLAKVRVLQLTQQDIKENAPEKYTKSVENPDDILQMQSALSMGFKQIWAVLNTIEPNKILSLAGNLEEFKNTIQNTDDTIPTDIIDKFYETQKDSIVKYANDLIASIEEERIRVGEIINKYDPSITEGMADAIRKPVNDGIKKGIESIQESGNDLWDRAVKEGLIKDEDLLKDHTLNEEGVFGDTGITEDSLKYELALKDLDGTIKAATQDVQQLADKIGSDKLANGLKKLRNDDAENAFDELNRRDLMNLNKNVKLNADGDWTKYLAQSEGRTTDEILGEYNAKTSDELNKRIENIFNNSQQTLSNAIKQSYDKTVGTARQLFGDIMNQFDLSVEGAKNLSNTLMDIQHKFGDQGLQDFADVLNELDTKDVGDFLNNLDEIDWNDPKLSVSDLRDQLNQLGVDTSTLSNGALQQLIDKMKEAAGISFDEADEKYQAYMKAGQMQVGETGLSQKEYDQLDAEDQSKFFYDAATQTYALNEAAKDWSDWCYNKGVQGFKDLTAAGGELDKTFEGLENVNVDKLGKLDYQTGYQVQTDENGQETTGSIVGGFKDENGYKNLQDTIQFLEQAKIITKESADEMRHYAENTSTLYKTISSLNPILNSNKDAIKNAKKELEGYQAAQKEIKKGEQALASAAQNWKQLSKLEKEGAVSAEEAAKASKLMGDKRQIQMMGEYAKTIDSTNKEIKKLVNEGKIGQSSLKNFSKATGDTQKETAKLQKQLKQDYVSELTRDLLETTNGVRELATNWEDWGKAIEVAKDQGLTLTDAFEATGKKGKEASVAVEDLKNSLGGILDTEAELVSDDFITSHSDLIAQAAKGSQDAIDQLRIAMAEDFVEMQLCAGEMSDEVRAKLQEASDAVRELQLHPEMDISQVEEALNELLIASASTVSEANTILDDYGMNAKVEMVEVESPNIDNEVTKTAEQHGTQTFTTYDDIAVVHKNTDEEGNESVSISHEQVKSIHRSPNITEKVNTAQQESTDTTTAKSIGSEGKVKKPQIKKGTLSHTGGKTGSSRRAPAAAAGANPSGGKSGGGGKGKKPKKGKSGGGKGKKDKGKSLERVSVERDKYYDINRQLSLYDQRLERINWHQDHYANSSYLRALDEELNLLRLQNIALQKKSDIEVHDLQSRQKTLKNDYKVKFTEDGLLDEGTYNKIRLKYKKKINDLAGEGKTEAEEKLYNKLKKQLDRFEKKVDKYNEIYDQHEETLMSMISNQDRNRELNRIKIDERLEQIQEKRAIKTDSLTRATERYARILSKLQDQESTYLQGSKAWLTNKGKQIEALEKQLAVQKRLAKYQKETAVQEKKEMQSDLRAMSKSSADSAYKRLQKENAKTVKKNTKTVVKKGPMGTSAGSILAKDKDAAAKYNTYIKKKSKSKYKSLLSTWKKDNPEKKLLAAEKKKLLAQAKKQAKDTKKAKKLNKNVWVAPSKLKKKLDRKSWNKIYGVDFVQNKNTWTSKKQKKLTSKKKQNKNIDKKLKELGMKGAYTHAKVAALLKKNRKQRKKVYEVIKKGTINEAESTMMLRDLYKKNTDLNSLELKRNKNSKDIKSLTKEQNKSAAGGLSEFQKYFVNDKNKYNQKKYNSFVKKMKKKGAWDKNGFKLSYDEDGMVSEKVRNAVNSLSDEKLRTWLNDKLDEIDNQTQEAKAAKELAEDLDAQAKQSKRDFRLEYVLNGNGRSGLNAALNQQNIEMSRLTYTMNRFNAARTKLAGRKLADNIEQENTALRLQLDILKSRATLINSSIKQLKQNFKTEAVYDKDTGEKLGSLYNILTPELRTLWDKIDSDDATTEDYDNFTTALYDAQEDSTLSKNSSQILEVLNELIDKREESLENRSQQDENQDTLRENIITQQFAVIDNIQRKVEQINTSFADTFRLVNKELYETERAMNKAYGANKIKALAKMSEASKAEAEAQSALQQSLTNQASQAAQELKNFGLSIDENTGAILNEMEVLDRFDDKANVYELTNIYGADYADRLHSAISSWHSLQDAIESAYEAEQNALDKVIENRLQQWQIKIQASIDFNTNVDSASEFTKMLYNVADNDYIGLGRLLTRKMGERSRLKLDDGTYTSADDLAKALKSLQEFQQTGNGEFGNNESAYIENLTSAKEAVENMTTTLHNDLQEAKDLLLNQIDYIKSENDRQISMIDNQKSINDTIKSITKILGNKTIQKNNDGGYEITEVGKLLEQRDAYNAQKLGWLTEERNFWQAQALSENFGGMPEEVQRKILDNLSETTQTLFSALETTLNDSLSKVQEMMEDTWNAWELDLGGGLSFDEINDDWTQEFKDSERYISDMELAYQMATIDKTYRKKAESYADDANAQKTILKILEDQLSILSKQEKVRKADVDLVKKKMDLTLAQIALEEAQNNKSKLRLSRDSQGNYTYRYVADDDNTEDAQVKAMEKSHDVYTASYNQWKDTQKQSMEELKTLKSELDKNSMSILSTPQEDNERLEKLYEQRNKIVSRFNKAMAQLNKDFAIDNKNLLTASWADVKTMAASYASEAVPAAVQSASDQLDAMMKEANEEFILADGINRGIIEEFNELLYTSYDEWKREALETCQANAGEITTLYDTNGIAPLALQAFGQEVDKQFGNLSARQATTVTEFTKTHVVNYTNSIQEIMNKIQKLMDDSLGTGDGKDTKNDTWQGRMTNVIGQMDTLVDGHKGKIQDIIDIIGAGIGGTSTKGATMATALTQLATQSDKSIKEGAVKDQAAWNIVMETGLTDLQNIYDEARNNAATFKENIAGPWKKANDELSKYLELAAKANEMGGKIDGGSKKDNNTNESFGSSGKYKHRDSKTGQLYGIDEYGNITHFIREHADGTETWEPVPSGSKVNVQQIEAENAQEAQKEKEKKDKSLQDAAADRANQMKQETQQPPVIVNTTTTTTTTVTTPVIKTPTVTPTFTPSPLSKTPPMTPSSFGATGFGLLKKRRRGGYIGDWGDESGRPAILHRGEFVLNRSDTQNFLEALQVTREIANKIGHFNLDYTNAINPNLISESLQPVQNNNTYITADFPGVSQAHEIELAFESLKSKAAQRISQINR